MSNKLLLVLASVFVVLLLTYGYQALQEKKAPDIGNFIEGVTCEKKGNDVYVTSAQNTQAVISFTPDGTKIIGFKFYETPVTISSRSIPKNLLGYITKYGYLVDFAK